MTSGLIQLASFSISNSSQFLTGNPQITFFKSLYKQYSNFYITTIEQSINGTPDFNRNIDCTISKSGHLLKNIYLEIILPDLEKPSTSSWYGYTNNIGCNIIKSVTLKINDQIIDKIYGTSIDIYNCINNNSVDKMVLEYNSDYSIRNTGNTIPLSKRTVYLNLPFWFSKNSGLALPLISLNNSNITLDIEFNALHKVIKTDNYNNLSKIKIKTNEIMDVKIFTECIFLDSKELQFFANKSHDYLIEQLQFNGQEILLKNDTTKNVYVDFRHPVKELYWTISVDDNNIDSKLQNDVNNITRYTSYYSNYEDTFDNLTIKLNSMTLLEEKKNSYFRILQSNLYYNNIRKKHIYSYSFSLNPNQQQPSGSINFTDLNNVLFIFNFKDSLNNTIIENGCSTNGLIKIYAVNYNILKIASGLGSLQYVI